MDNIVIDFRAEHIVFGGCLVKAANAQRLENTADAAVKSWPVSLMRMEDVFPHTSFVVPGHGPITHNAGQHVLELLWKYSTT